MSGKSLPCQTSERETGENPLVSSKWELSASVSLVQCFFSHSRSCSFAKKKTKPNPKTLALGLGTAVFFGGGKKKKSSFFSLQTLGHIGKVIKVYGDGDLRVSVGGQSWTFNPACLTAYQREEEANLMTTESAKESKSEGQVWAPRGWQLLDPALWLVVKSRCCSVDGELKPSCALLGKQSLGKCRV